MNRSTNRSVSGDRKSRPYSVSVTAGFGTIPGEVWKAVLQKRQGCSKLDGILRTERNRLHAYLQPVQMASLPSGYHFALRPVVPPVSDSATETWRR